MIAQTERGEIDFRYYPVDDAVGVAIWVGGIGGGWDTPAKDLYPKLCHKLMRDHIASLRIQLRDSQDLEESVFDVLAGVEFFKNQGITNLAYIGYSMGGAAVILAAAFSQLGKTVIALSAQSLGAQAAADLPFDCSLLLVHGADDTVLPYRSSEYIYELAHHPKDLVILERSGHTLDESAEEVHTLVYEWIKTDLES